jgi:hypothetical protein
MLTSSYLFFQFWVSYAEEADPFPRKGMPQNLLEPTWMELDSDDHFDRPERGRRTQHEVPGATRRFEDFIDTYAPDVGTGPRLPAELLCL